MSNKLTFGLFIGATGSNTQGVAGFWLEIKQNRERVGAKAVRVPVCVVPGSRQEKPEAWAAGGNNEKSRGCVNRAGEIRKPENSTLQGNGSTPELRVVPWCSTQNHPVALGVMTQWRPVGQHGNSELACGCLWSSYPENPVHTEPASPFRTQALPGSLCL